MSEHTADLSPSAMVGSMTGFDEVAVAKAFGQPIEELRPRPFMFLRALAFVHERRAGRKDPDAYRTVMELGTDAVSAYFPPEEDPLAGEDSEEGKGSGDSGP